MGNRKYPLVVGKGNGVEQGDTAGQELKGLGQAMHISRWSGEDVIRLLYELDVEGTTQQLSRARCARQALTLPGEIRLMEICGYDSPNQLIKPAYDAEMAERIRETYKRSQG